MVKFDLIIYKFHLIRRILRYSILIMIAIGIGLMIGGRTGGGFTFFKEWNVPVYGYVLTAAIIIVLSGLLISKFLQNSTDGEIIVYENKVRINLLGKIKDLETSQIQIIDISTDFRFNKFNDEYPKKITMICNHETIEINAIIDESESKNLIAVIKK